MSSTSVAARELVRLPADAEDQAIADALARDGGVVLSGMLSRAQVDAINADLDPLFAAMEQGNFGQGENGFVADFNGHRTKRLQHTLSRSATYRNEFLANPRLAELASIVLPEQHGRIGLFASQCIEIQPGETAQELHRDGGALLDRLGAARPGGVELLANTLLALCDITEDMGATRVIPGSHLWPDYAVKADQSQSIPAVMKAGDILLFSGRVLHGGGANVTRDRTRRLISTAFVPNFFMSEEAWPFALDLEEVRNYPPALQAMIGFRSVCYRGEEPGFLWRVNNNALERHLGL